MNKAGMKNTLIIKERIIKWMKKYRINRIGFLRTGSIKKNKCINALNLSKSRGLGTKPRYIRKV